MKIEDSGAAAPEKLSSILYPQSSDNHPPSSILNETQYAQPALFVIEYALARLWMAWGVRPQAMIGHSIGEYVAACLAGVISLEAALELVALRGRLMQALPPGAMIAVPLPEKTIRTLLDEELALAAVNAPALCVVSGPPEAIARLQERLTRQGTEYRRLHTSHAFHSHMMDPMLRVFAQHVEAVELKAPRIPYISNLTGTWITDADATDPGYWARHLRQPVRFAEGVGVLLAEADRILLEVGPGHTVSTFAQQHPDLAPTSLVLSSLRHPHERRPDTAFLMQNLGRLWLAGAAIDWPRLYAYERRLRVPLPTYPFERQRYWIGPGEAQENAGAAVEQRHGLLPEAIHARPGLKNPYVAPSNEVEQIIADIWQRCLGVQQVGVHDNFFELGGHSLLATQILAQVRHALDIEVPLHILFEAATVAGMTMAVVQMKLEQLDDAALMQMLSEVRSLPPDEAQATLSADRVVDQAGYAHE